MRLAIGTKSEMPDLKVKLPEVKVFGYGIFL